MKLCVINGPNLNMLGIREPKIYGTMTYKELEGYIKNFCRSKGIEVSVHQSNYEGKLVDIIQDSYKTADAIIINPAGYTHTSIAILDALKAVGLPCVEVHLSDVKNREDFRQISYAGMACIKTFSGLGAEGYGRAVLFLEKYLSNRANEIVKS